MSSFRAHPHQQLQRHEEENFNSWGEMASKGQGTMGEGIGYGILLSFNEEYMEVNFELELDFDRGENDWIVCGDSMERIENAERAAGVSVND